MITTNIESNTQNETVEVLYQKMGNRWFAFSHIDGEIFVGSISQEEIDALEAKVAAKNPVFGRVGHA
jgi:hypothetical protein